VENLLTLGWILKHIPQSSANELASRCWVHVKLLKLVETHPGTSSNAFSNRDGAFLSSVPTDAMSVTLRIRINLTHFGCCRYISPIPC